MRPLATLFALSTVLISTSSIADNLVETSTIPKFDPNGHTTNLDDYDGSDRPDEFLIMQAIEGQFERIERCVQSEKNRRNSSTPLKGELLADVLLNPQGKRPLAMNTDLPKTHKKRISMRKCLRQAVATAPYPAYDGPPVVVNFAVELDPPLESDD